MRRFLDTYAIVEILNGNPDYRGVLEDAATSLYHLYELHVQLARLRDEATANAVYRDLRSLAVEATDADVLAASRFKRAHPKAGFSYADALGYAMARERDVPFVTGDKAFRKIDGVAFIAGRK
ncbi:MAG TPA: PIN domain-containing protein [Candidatus Thermoplasmatota archaeon]|nr:PIN domain-containing protein [Candidatus Thermoplasmatota archaeon]